MNTEQRERDIASLVQAAKDILEYVTDPGEPPPSSMHASTMYHLPKSPARIAREQANRLEQQSRAVRDLKHALTKFSEPEIDPAGPRAEPGG